MECPSETPPPLRLGLLLNDEQVPAWVARMLARIDAEGHAQVCLIVLRDPQTPAPPADPSRPLRRGLSRLTRGLLHRLLRWVTERRPQLPDPFTPVDIAARYGAVPRLVVRPLQQVWSDRLDEAALDRIREHRLDVLVRVGFRILRGDVLKAARYGVWSYHHGDNRVNRGGPPGWWEAMEQWPVTGCTLQVLSEDLDNGPVLARTWSQTIGSSARDNNAQNYWKSLALLPRELARLRRLGPQVYFAAVDEQQSQPQIYSDRLYRNATAPELLRLLLRRLWHRLVKTWTLLTTIQQWGLLVQRRAGVDDGALNLALWRFRRLVPPPDRFWADPFLAERDGRTWVFFEELPYGCNRGHISVAELTGEGELGPPMTALAQPHHLSYPFVFEHEGTWYLLPESRGSGRLTLYRSAEWPHRWEPVMDLMTGVQLVDATLLQHEGRWWMFANVVETDGASSSDELHLFHATDFRTQDWTPHPLNPIVSDVRRARPAGRILQRHGQLLRPAQDCSLDYGWGFSLMRIDRLTPDDYAETPVATATPRWAPDVRATHTLASGQRYTVVDACLLQRGSWVSLRRQVSRWTARR
jgi:hypothetical protein